jgi:hypothetical protein
MTYTADFILPGIISGFPFPFAGVAGLTCGCRLVLPDAG